ncbi:MAG: 3-deoxy-manno-octulosonate cytidylyltransferase [Gemmatimonadota bacterium]|nr:MAG: 3-deoxy-manno-octulosonate cytidylyltransferase [Gemmatimonadota bacterium]
MKTVGVIPARYGSKRFPGKPLVDLFGKPMVQWVWEGVCQSRRLSRVIVATDDDRIYKTVSAFGGEAVMTRYDHPSGTDRVAEVAADMEVDVVVNIQGDEPLIEGRILDRLVSAFDGESGVEMVTCAAPFDKDTREIDPHTAKVVVDKNGFALYFSRWPIPYAHQEPKGAQWKGPLQHIGVYGFRKNFLMTYTTLCPAPLEEIEGLEQLRALEHGYRIKVLEVDHQPLNVDTERDLERVKTIMRERGIR